MRLGDDTWVACGWCGEPHVCRLMRINRCYRWLCTTCRALGADAVADLLGPAVAAL